jgi:hypothetical protein
VLTARRTLIIGSCFVVVAIAAACGGGGPTSPSGIGGATIAGTVNLNGGAASAATAGTASVYRGAIESSANAATSLMVTVVGTNLSATVESSGYFHLAGVPSGTVSLQFRGGVVNATVELSNVRRESLIEIRVQVTGTSVAIVDEVRSNSKVSLCHRADSGSYQMIDVSQSAEPAHRAHGDGKVGDPVPGQPLKVFDQSCRAVGPEVQIVKSTNGQDANEAPGPTIVVGSPITWTYVVTNTGAVPLTSVSVLDDRNVTVTCPGTSVAVGQSMTCTGSGVATAGQYRNVGTVTASSSAGRVTDTDASHYFGQALVVPTVPTVPGADIDTGSKVQLCHRTGNGRYQLMEVSISAESAHRAHGDGKIGEAVPGMPGKLFGAGCSVN